MNDIFPGIKTIELEACPTTSCTALLLVLPSLTRGAKTIEMAVGKFANDLGLGVLHGEGCTFGAAEAVTKALMRCQAVHENASLRVKTREAGYEITDVHEAVTTPHTGAANGDVKSEEEEERAGYGLGDDGLEHEWVGEGEGADFWV